MKFNIVIQGAHYDLAGFQTFCKATHHENWIKDLAQAGNDWFDDTADITLTTSGSTGIPEPIALSKECIIESAIRTSEVIGLRGNIKALCPLPLKYVGGRMMLYRAIHFGWTLHVDKPTSHPLFQITDHFDFIAMTPHQLSKSLKSNPDCTQHISNIILGGGPIQPSLIDQIKQLKSNIFHTYGMTETYSHVALKKIGHQKNFQAVRDVRFSQNSEGQLIIDAPHLNLNNLITNDFVELINDTTFHWLGRKDNVINSGGIKIYPEEIEEKLNAIIPTEFFIGKLEDDEFGERPVLWLKGMVDPKILKVIQHFISADLNKYQRPKFIYLTTAFSYTETGKIKRNAPYEIKDRLPTVSLKLDRDQHITLDQDDLFAVVSFPDEKDYTMYFPREKPGSGADLPITFAIHPFAEKQDCPSIQFEVGKALLNPEFTFSTDRTSDNVDQQLGDYLLSSSQAIQDMDSGLFQKIVLSRTISIPNKNDITAVFKTLIERNKSAFVFLFNIPNFGTWMGSSPEILLEKIEGGFETHSLAGTMSLDRYNNGEVWSKKEVEEQEIVNRFLRTSLKDNSINFEEDEVQTVTAGNVVHLKSTFKITGNPAGILNHIHPSPALGAFPQDAIGNLNKYEKTNRKYYCGYLGIDDPDGKTTYCINLRSMEVFKDKYCLYVGGGITKDSSAEKEWEEGQLKAQVLLEAIKKSKLS